VRHVHALGARDLAEMARVEVGDAVVAADLVLVIRTLHLGAARVL
jgi:hypothetical protein